MATDEFAGNGAEMQVPKWKRGDRDGWGVEAPADCSWITIVEAKRKAPVAMVCSQYAYDVYGRSDSMQEYASLIIAAPALRAALAKMVEVYGDMQDGNGDTPAEIAQARAALRKAGGNANG